MHVHCPVPGCFPQVSRLYPAKRFIKLTFQYKYWQHFKFPYPQFKFFFVFCIQRALARILRQNAGAKAPSRRVLCATRCEHFIKCPISGWLNPPLMEKSVYPPPLEAGVLGHLIKKTCLRDFCRGQGQNRFSNYKPLKKCKSLIWSFLIFILNYRPDKLTEQRVWPVWTGFEFRMKLNSYKPGMFWIFYYFHKSFIWWNSW